MFEVNIEKFNNFFIKRIVFLMICFILVNVVANVSSESLITDLFSHFKLQYFYLAIFFLFSFSYLSFFKKKFILFAIVSILIMGINFVSLKPFFNQSFSINGHNKDIRVGLFNVLTSNKKYALVIKEIENENPDIVIAQETNSLWLENIASLKEKYPFFIEHPRDDNFGIALYSKLPILEKSVEFWTEDEVPVVKVLFEKENKRILLYAVHTLPPVSKEYFLTRNEMLKNINQIIVQNNKKNIIIAGDFNTTNYSPNYKKYIGDANIFDAYIKLGNIFDGSWNVKHPPFMRITLEHVLSTKDITPITYKKGSDIGSDHFPVFVDFSL